MRLKPRFSFIRTEALDSWEEGLYKATREFLHAGVLSSYHLMDVVDVIHKSGRELAITKDTVILHAQSYDHVNEPFIAYLYTRQSVHFFGKHIHHLFVFGAKSPQQHQTMLARISYFITALQEDDSLKDEAAMVKWFKKQATALE